MGKIYLIGQADTPNIYKIGCTKGSVEKRTKSLQTGNSEELFVKETFETNKPHRLETMLHNHFRNNHYLNEWYSLTNEDVTNFHSICEKYQSIIDSLKDNPFF